MPLIDDPDTGMSVQKVIYRAGHTTTWHTHPCAHGMYVLEGTTLVIGDERVAEHRGAHGFRSLTEVDIETLQRSLDVKPRP